MRFNGQEQDRLSLSGRLRPLWARAALAAAVVLTVCGALSAAGLEPFESGGKWGFREAGADKAAVPPVFDRAYGFQEGLAPVLLLGKWGYCDETGQLVLEPKYAQARPFSEGSAEIRLEDGQWAVIDKAGGVIRLSASPALGVRSEGLALFARDGKFGYMNERGKAVIAAEFAAAGLFREGLAPAKKEKWGFIDKEGGFVIKPGYDGAREFSGGLAAFLKDGKWGFLNKSGRTVIGNNFHDARDFSEGLAAVRLNGRWGYIDRKGAFAVWPEYDDALPFSGGLAAAVFPVPAPKGSAGPVFLERRWLDKTGKVVYRSPGPAGDGMEVIVSSENKFGYARDLKPVIRPEYEDAAGCGEGTCLVKKDGKYAFIDYAGSTTLKTDLEEATALGCAYRVKLGVKYGIMSSTGGLIAPAVYDVIEGTGCAGPLAAALDGTEGRLDPASGVFTPAAAAAEPPPIPLGEKCLQVEKAVAGLPYGEIPGYCSADELRTILRTRPDCLNCRLALVTICSSAAAAGAAAPEAPLEALAEAIKVFPDEPRFYQWRAGLLLSSGPAGARLAEALADYKQLVRLLPCDDGPYGAVCAVYSSSGAAQEGREAGVYYCDMAVKLKPDAGNYFSRGGLRKSLGDYAGAMEDFRAALKADPRYAPARLARARLSAELGQDFRTVFDYSCMLAEERDNPEALEGRGMAYIRLGVCAKAKVDLRHAGRVRPGAGSLQNLAVYYWRCEKNTPKAIEIAEQLLQMGEQCGGPCWRQADYENYLLDLYRTAEYNELLKKYGLPVPEQYIYVPPPGQVPAQQAVVPPSLSTAPAPQAQPPAQQVQLSSPPAPAPEQPAMAVPQQAPVPEQPAPVPVQQTPAPPPPAPAPALEQPAAVPPSPSPAPEQQPKPPEPPLPLPQIPSVPIPGSPSPAAPLPAPPLPTPGE